MNSGKVLFHLKNSGFLSKQLIFNKNSGFLIQPKLKSLQNILLPCILFLYSISGFTQEKIRIACIGNSITHGAGIENREINSYPAQLAAMLGDGYEVQNFGVNGATLLRKGDLPYQKTAEYQQALQFKPNWVFIKLGTNDTKPLNRIFLNEYVQDYKDLIATFRQLPGSPRVVLLLPIPVSSSDTTGINSYIVRDKLLPMIQQVAYETDYEVIDLYSLLVESEELVPDKIHPSAEGATVIARRIYELVRIKSESGNCFPKELLPDAKPFNFYGFQAFDFIFKNRNAKIVVPKHVAPGHPWIWRARFWGHEPQTDIALLERGFHVVYCDVSELFGNKEALSVWNDYYHFLTRKCRLSMKSVMEGMSRGGIYIYRWAAKYPERVAAVYADAPVLDLKSWPGGKGQSPGSAADWETFKKDFNLKTEKDALSFKGNPIDLTDKIAGSGFPMMHVVGDADDVVPVDENTTLFEKGIKEKGGNIQVIHKPGIGHHPHSLQNPRPIVDFILQSTGYQLLQ